MGQEAQPDHSWNNHDPDVKCISSLCFVTVNTHMSLQDMLCWVWPLSLNSTSVGVLHIATCI